MSRYSDEQTLNRLRRDYLEPDYDNNDDDYYLICEREEMEEKLRDKEAELSELLCDVEDLKDEIEALREGRANNEN